LPSTPQAVSDGAINTRLTTENQIEAAETNGDAVEIDLGFSFTCTVVSAATYEHGTPIGG
jgi:hypothetical protein